MKKLLLALFIAVGMTATAQTMMPLPAQNSTFGGNVRGFYFTAPTCFTITGLKIPADISGVQSIAVVRFWSNQTPPLFSVTTNAFTILYLTQNNPSTGILPVNIQVEQGDVIGILGQAGTTNSYATAPAASNIAGYPVTLARLGMQFSLTTTSPQQLWTENGGSISRVEMYYDSTITFSATHTVLNQSDVQFNNNADSSFASVWDYGDGSPLDNAFNPMHTYATGGTYQACNYITTSCGTDTICMSVTVCGSTPTIAGFVDTANAATVTFFNSTTGATTYWWDFGDSSTDTAANPVHTYAASGTYTVCLYAFNGACYADTICSTVTVCIPTTTNFTATEDTTHTWMFTDMSTNATMWMWDFGDASGDTAQNPTHMYAANGTYTVCLTSMDCAADTFCTTITTCPEILTVGFISTDTLMDASFTSNANSAVSYLWNFGDNSFDTVANPTHTYGATGLYTVCLTVWNLCGDSMTTCDTVLLIITDNNMVNGNASVEVYPNPASEAATVLVTSAEHTGNYVFEMYDAAGKLVRTENGYFGQQLKVQRNELSVGSYIYKVRVNNEVISNGRLMFAE